MVTSALEEIVGPRVPPEELKRRWPRYFLPTALLALAAVALVVSWFLPYWHMTLLAPQYPKGLHVTAYLNRLEGDVREIDGLNHYIGMRPLEEAAQLERSLSVMLVGVLALLVLAGVLIHNWWAALLTLPAILFPAGFLADLYYWLSNFGQNLDPRAPLSNAVKPFTPPVIGVGTVGQFKTVASVGVGWWVAAGASLVILIALWFHRRAYKPLVEARRAARRSGACAPADPPAEPRAQRSEQPCRAG